MLQNSNLGLKIALMACAATIQTLNVLSLIFDADVLFYIYVFMSSVILVHYFLFSLHFI